MELDDEEFQIVFNVDSQLDEDAALLTDGGDVDYKRIILRSVCDILLESNDKEVAPVAIFVDQPNRHPRSYYQSLSDIFDVRYVLVNDSAVLDDNVVFCAQINDVIK